MKHKLFASLAFAVIVAATAFAQSGTKTPPQLQVVGTAHLDTQWRWTIQNSINEFIPATFRDNFKLMDLYPDYVFSFEGSFRYKILREYYPEEWAKLKKYVDSGQWRVAGSWVDAVDVNIPSFESLVRHNLYGNGFYKREFGKTSRDIFLPDCFGFGYALPSIAKHCGIQSFTTQKLAWGSAVGIPFDIGTWEGVDGSSIVACLNAGDYTGKIHNDLSSDTSWIRRINAYADTAGLNAGYTYFGTGDTGGSPESLSVAWLSKSLKSNGPIQVKSVGSDDLIELVKSADKTKLPHYKGELVMTRHGVGCYTSQAAMKRWNRKNELLADAAERASVIAHLTAGVPYPTEYFRDTWERFLWHQFHDDVTGTSIPEAYEFSWNDEILCQNRFAAALENATASTTPLLDTKVGGLPIVVGNSLAINRRDVVEASFYSLPFQGEAELVGPDGRIVALQPMAGSSEVREYCFQADVKPLSQSVFYLRETKKKPSELPDLSVSSNTLENSRYKILINANGDVESIFDKKLNVELLDAPIQFQLLFDKPRQWPAWELQYEDIIKPPVSTVGGPAVITVVERGPVRASILIVRKTATSAFRTTISLTAHSDRIEFKSEIDWYEKETLLKVAFPLTCANDSVTYDLGLGAIKRGLNTKQKYEVPGQQWADMTDPSGKYGVAILNDCKYGWDHPDPGILRLSLIHTPGVFESWNWVGDQKSQDMGHHEFTFAIVAHEGDWSSSDIPEQAARLNQPPRAFEVARHDGKLGRQFSLLEVDAEASGNNVFVNAVKMAEAGDEVIVRVKETNGRAATAKINFAFPVISAREVNGFEEQVGSVSSDSTSIQFSLTPFQPKAFAVKLKTNPSDDLSAIKWTSLSLPFDLDAISLDKDRKDGNIDGYGNSLAGELIPDTLVYLGIPFVMGPKSPQAMNTVSCNGQRIKLPKGGDREMHILACAVNGATDGELFVDYFSHRLWIQDYAEPIAQWNNRLVAGNLNESKDGIAPGYVNRQPIAWYGSHRHTADGQNEAYRMSYLFESVIPIEAGSLEITLPNNPNIKVFAITLAEESSEKFFARTQSLYDEISNTVARVSADSSSFVGKCTVRMSTPNPGAMLFYTLDGSSPTIHSTRYTEPITLSATTKVQARALLDGKSDHFVTSATYRQLVPRGAVKVGELKPGLAASYFEGEWQKLPSFDSLQAKSSFIADSVVLPKIAREEDFGLTFNGYFLAPTEGLYEFALSSDDGSKLFIGDSLVVDNDGLHGGGDVMGRIALKPGYHPLYIPMFQCKGGRELDLHVSGPGLPRERLVSNRLFHAE